jgi:hypothetical protein
MPPRRNLMRDDAYAYSGSSRTGGNDPRWETADATSPDKRQRARAEWLMCSITARLQWGQPRGMLSRVLSPGGLGKLRIPTNQLILRYHRVPSVGREVQNRSGCLSKCR